MPFNYGNYGLSGYNYGVTNTGSSLNGLGGQLGSIIGGLLGGPSNSQNQAAVNAASPFNSQYAQYQPGLENLIQKDRRAHV